MALTKKELVMEIIDLYDAKDKLTEENKLLKLEKGLQKEGVVALKSEEDGIFSILKPIIFRMIFSRYALERKTVIKHISVEAENLVLYKFDEWYEQRTVSNCVDYDLRDQISSLIGFNELKMAFKDCFIEFYNDACTQAKAQFERDVAEMKAKAHEKEEDPS